MLIHKKHDEGNVRATAAGGRTVQIVSRVLICENPDYSPDWRFTLMEQERARVEIGARETGQVAHGEKCAAG